MSLFNILACPHCKVHVERNDQQLICIKCHRRYPIVNGIPVLLPDSSIPITQYQHELNIRPSYDPWIHRVVLQSLHDSAVILDVGAGNLVLDLPNVIRMDVTLTPYVDIVGDVHALPFLPDTFDFIFSLAVFEHLRQPFVAAREIFAALRNGGYIYNECNFVFAYHGYPHHYFNASKQGLEQVFANFEVLRSGVAPYQMPSFAIRMLLSSYIRDLQSQNKESQALKQLFQNVLDQPLGTYDGFFSEDVALNTAAGVFVFGRKHTPKSSEVIPAFVQNAWTQAPDLQQAFPNMFNLGTASNVMIWAKTQGRRQFNAIEEGFRTLTAFQKDGSDHTADIQSFQALPLVEPVFGNIPDTQRSIILSKTVEQLQEDITDLEAMLTRKNEHIVYLESLIEQFTNGRLMKLLSLLPKRKLK